MGTGLPLDQYKANIWQIVQETLAADIKVLIFTTTVIHQDPNSGRSVTSAPYNDFLKELAAEKKLPVAELNAATQEEIRNTLHASLLLTVDGVHLNVAATSLWPRVLRGSGLNHAQVQKALDSRLAHVVFTTAGAAPRFSVCPMRRAWGGR